MESESNSVGKHTRVLCLHGYRQNAKVFKEKLGSFRKMFKKQIDFHFLDAPHIINNETNEEERSWWFTTESETFSSTDPSEICIGLDKSIELFRETCNNHGPFDGVLGFSQGAAFAAMLCSCKITNLKFVILVAGFVSQIPSHSTFYEVPIMIPSLHVIGKTDSVILSSRSNELRNCFENHNAETIYHEGGHYVPIKGLKQQYISFINNIVSKSS